MATLARSNMEKIFVFGGTTDVLGARSDVTWFLKRFKCSINHFTQKLSARLLVLRFLLDFGDCSFASLAGHNLSKLLLSDGVVGVGDEVLAYFGESESNASVAL
jgi:hypothetical protein